MGDNALSGLLPGGTPSVFLFSSSPYDDRWIKAELFTADLIGRIQPSIPSEERRKAVILYVEQLIQRYFDCQVCTFGSVPLKTYLPDGDIDLTAFSWLQQLNDTWANDLRTLLENEEHNKDAKFSVKEVQCIHAEVQIVKCLVENIIVDISFNQLGGLCTLCFLEEVDQLIGKDHLFKRSIILIKAWCFYESRILGAHHGLISTYALETLVLYIFHVFHASLRGPLEVLFRFLQFFSRFDWEHYCLSLWGPIRLSALKDMAAEPPQKHGGQLLLSHAFLYACSQAYAALPLGQDTQGRIFSSKYMNVVDPLRINNNLGRSVSRGNFYRIRSAFAYGARKLEKILRGPAEELVGKLDDFFLNTKKHCTGVRPDALASDLEHLNAVAPVPCGAEGEENQSNDLGQANVASAAKNHSNHVVQNGGAVVTSVMANAIMKSEESVNHAIDPSKNTIPALGYSASNGHSHGAANSITIGKAKKGTANRGRNPSVLVSDVPSTSTMRLKGADSVKVTEMAKQESSVEVESVSHGNDLAVDSRGDVENAKDLASYQDGFCECATQNYLHKQTSFCEPIPVSYQSRAISSSGPSLSCVARLGNQASAHSLNRGLEGVRKGNKRSGHYHPVSRCCCQAQISDGGNQPCVDHPLVPSTVQASMMLASVSPCFYEGCSFQSAALPQVLPVANPLPAHVHNLTLGCTSCVLEHQNQLSCEEHQKSCESCLRSTGTNEARGGSTDTSCSYENCVAAPVVPPGFSSVVQSSDLPDRSRHMAHASTRNEIGGRLSFEDSSDTFSPSELEARSALAAKGSNAQILQDGKEGMKENTSCSSNKDSDFHHIHDSVNSTSGHCTDHINVSGLEALSGFELSEKESARLKVGLPEEEISQMGKYRNHLELVSKSDVESVHLRDVERTTRNFVADNIANMSTDEEKTSSRTRLSDIVTVSEKEKIIGAFEGSNAIHLVDTEGEIAVANGSSCPLTEASIVDQLSNKPRRLDHPGMMPYPYFHPPPLAPFLTAPNLSWYNMNSMGNGKARIEPHSSSLRTNNTENTCETSNDNPVIFGVGEALMASGIPVTNGVRLDEAHAATVLERAESEEFQADILRGDFVTHLHNLQVGRCYQTSQLYGPLMFQAAPMFPPRHMQEQYAWEGPGRLTGNMDMFAQFFGYRHEQFPDPMPHGLNLHNAFAFPANFYGEEVPKFHRGTGTYLPNLMSGSYRDRQLVGGGRGSRGAKFPDRSDPVTRVGANAFPSRYRGMARGQSRHEGRPHTSKLNTRFEKNNTETKMVGKGSEMSREERTVPVSPVSSGANVGNSCDLSTQVSVLEPFVDTGNKNYGNRFHGGNTSMLKPRVVFARPYANEKVISAENLRFGSLGSPSIQNGAGEDHEGPVSEHQRNLKYGGPTKSGETIATKVPFDDSQQSSYQLKDEDFPPLSFHGQSRASTGFDVQKGLGNGRPHYQACALGTSS